jgi:hypothetical protein
MTGKERIAEVRRQQASGSPLTLDEMAAAITQLAARYKERRQAGLCLGGCGEPTVAGCDGYCRQHGFGW